MSINDDEGFQIIQCKCMIFAPFPVQADIKTILNFNANLFTRRYKADEFEYFIINQHPTK